jgi:hypothetical protein
MACKAGNHIVAKLLLESGEDKVHSIEIPDKVCAKIFHSV